MNIVLKSVEIIDSVSDFNNQKKNILIEDGIIKRITDKDIKADKVIESPNLKVSIGWFDMRATMGDPGFEHREDIASISAAAAQGGFTEIACLPNTKPVIQHKDIVHYIKSSSLRHLVQIHPIAAVTKDAKGEDLTEMIDLHYAGAVAFSDGIKSLSNSDILLKSLQYLQTFNGLLINHAEDSYVSLYGQMNEGKTSTILGFKGIPKLAEELIIERDLRILEYTGGKIHFPHISSPRSLDLIREAKNKGLRVTCDIAAYTLALADTELESFNTNLKVNPPLRSKEDIAFFWKAITDDTIDAIVSDHLPQDEEGKNLEFDLAEFGMTGLETLFGVVNSYNKRIGLNRIIHKITYSPREILSLPVPVIKEGAEANLTVFDPDVEWVYGEKAIKSKSKNSPFMGHKLRGKAIAVFNKKKCIIN